MKKTKRLDPWMAVTLAILGCYLLFLIYPMFNLLRQSVFNGETGAFTLEYFQKFFGKSYYFSTLWNSFKVSVAATVITSLKDWVGMMGTSTPASAAAWAAKFMELRVRYR